MSSKNGAAAKGKAKVAGPKRATAPAPGDELAALVEGIKGDLKAAGESRREQLTRFHAAGGKLTRAKALGGHGKWGKWLKESFDLTDRQARRYMEFAKTDVTSDLKELEKRWREVSGNGGKGKKSGGTGTAKPELTDDGSWVIPLKSLPRERAEEVRAMLEELAEAWGTKDVTATVVDAIRFAHREVKECLK